MNRDDYMELAKARLERAESILEEASMALEWQKYNRQLSLDNGRRTREDYDG